MSEARFTEQHRLRWWISIRKHIFAILIDKLKTICRTLVYKFGGVPWYVKCLFYLEKMYSLFKRKTSDRLYWRLWSKSGSTTYMEFSNNKKPTFYMVVQYHANYSTHLVGRVKPRWSTYIFDVDMSAMDLDNSMTFLEEWLGVKLHLSRGHDT